MQIQNANVFTRPGQCAEQFQELQICVSPQFRMIDSPNPTRGFIRQNQNVRFATAACHPKFQNVRFATAACTKMHETNAGRLWSPAACKNHRFTTVSDGRPARKGCSTVDGKICISPQFWTSDEHEVTRGLREHTENLHFTTVLGVRRSLFALRVASAT